MTTLLFLSLLLNLGLTGLSLFSLKVYRETNHNLRRDRLNSFQRESELIDRLMHMSGNTWTPPPRDLPKDDEVLIDEETKAALEGWREV